MADPMTHSHDTSTPALSVESEAKIAALARGYELMQRAIWNMAGTSGADAAWYRNIALAITGRVDPLWKVGKLSNCSRPGDCLTQANKFVADLAAAPAPNPSPAAKGGVNWTVNDLAEGLAALHGEGVSDEYREKADHLLAHLSFCASAACSPAEKGGEAEALRQAALNARAVLRAASERGGLSVTAEGYPTGGDVLHAIDQLEAALATPSPQPANTVPEADSSLPGMDWELSADTKARMSEIDRLAGEALSKTSSIVIGALATPSPQPAHSDDLAVDRFAVAMKAKLADARAKGKGGWNDDAECSQQYLSDELRRHALKPDPLDVANFAMFLHQRNEEIALPSPQPADAVREATAKALETCDWSDVSIGNKAVLRSAIELLRATTLASDPAPAGEAVELWHCVHKGSDNDFWTSEDKTAEACAASGRYDVSRKTLHPAPEDTARLREELERVTQELAETKRRLAEEFANMDATMKGWDALCIKCDEAERERDDARKALETARPIVEADLQEAKDAGDEDWEFQSASALAAIDAARSASREGASDE